MSDLICPDCGHDVDKHKGYQMSHVSETWIDELGRKHKRMCLCHLTEAEALRKAQRAAAIAHLRALGKEALEERECQEFFDDKSEAYMWRVSRVIDAIAAYRAVCILREPRK